MKKKLLTALVCALTATSAVLGQHTQSITFSGPSVWFPGTTISLDVYLTFSGYNALGLSYWLEVQNEVAPFIAITHIQYFTFPPPNQQPPYPIPFTGGWSNGFMSDTFDLGASVNNPSDPVVPGTYHINTITLSLGTGAPDAVYTIRTTSQSPRLSEVTDTDFNDNNIVPPGTFVIIGGIPEPSTLALLGFAAAFGALAYRRRNR